MERELSVKMKCLFIVCLCFFTSRLLAEEQVEVIPIIGGEIVKGQELNLSELILNSGGKLNENSIIKEVSLIGFSGRSAKIIFTIGDYVDIKVASELERNPSFFVEGSDSVQSTGDHEGYRVRRLRGFDLDGKAEITGNRCVSINGFSVHADTFIKKHEHQQRERLIRYVARPPLRLKPRLKTKFKTLSLKFPISSIRLSATHLKWRISE